jgi:hypothetical protein
MSMQDCLKFKIFFITYNDYQLALNFKKDLVDPNLISGLINLTVRFLN